MEFFEPVEEDTQTVPLPAQVHIMVMCAAKVQLALFWRVMMLVPMGEPVVAAESLVVDPALTQILAQGKGVDVLYTQGDYSDAELFTDGHHFPLPVSPISARTSPPD